MKVVIVGGVAAGAGAAARLRRLDETAEIILLERGPYISYANCGLPYHLGGVIPNRDSLFVISSAKFAARFNVDVRTESEAIAIDPLTQRVTVKHLGDTYVETYDRLLLATGSSPIMMDLPGLDPEKVFQFWTIPDMDKVMTPVMAGAKRAVVIGAGFIGLELAENLHQRGLSVTIVELAPQVLPTLDAEMGSYAAQGLLDDGVALRLGRKVVAFEKASEYSVVLDDGTKIPTDLVLMCVGVRPNSELAVAAGLKVGERKHIVVDNRQQTSDPNIYAAGDAVEMTDPITGLQAAVPLAGPANKQGRIAADNMAGGDSHYLGSLGASVIKVGEATAASVGLTERRLKQLKIAFRKIHTHPGSNASYFPGASMLHMKLLYGENGRILGAQAVGVKGADKRIDVIATAMASGRTAYDLADVELCYAPQYSSAKDPVNFLGMIARNVRDGLSNLVSPDELTPDAVLLDVREPVEFESGTIPGAINIPLETLRVRLGELDKSRKTIVFCRVGLRGYVAERILKQNGFTCANLSGGVLTWQAMNYKPLDTAPTDDSGIPVVASVESKEAKLLDVRGLCCPGPVVRLKMEIDSMKPGESVKLMAAASFAPDLASWIKSSGHELVALEKKADCLEAVVRKRAAAITEAQSGLAKNGDAAIILFSNDLDKALAALIIACGIAASGNKVSVFFTFWGLSVLRKNPAPAVKKSLISRMFGFMLPKGVRQLKLSKMNMAGLGTEMMKQVMAREQVPSLDELLKQAKELGVEFIACEMAMNVMGLQRDELIEVNSVAGVANFSELARNAGTTLFI